MILLTFQKQGTIMLGVKTPVGILDINAANSELHCVKNTLTPDTVFSQGLDALTGIKTLVDHVMEDDRRGHWLQDETQIVYGPCIPRPGKIICIGLNYRNHARESKLDVPPVPVLFSKFQNAVAAPGQPIPLPDVAEKYDYEAELVIVIGRQAKYISEDQALDYVLGYCNANDVSARELQGMTSQWLLGKSLDLFLPLGPYLVTSDEAPDPQNWPVRCWLNGELRQNSNTSDMIFSVRQLVSFISRHMTLEPGDIISTGTPEGVILGKHGADRVWMKPGDSMTVEVGPLGKLTNVLVREQR